MELELTVDQEIFADATRKLLEDQVPVAALRAGRHSPSGFERAYWRDGAQIGWTSPLVAEENGGGSLSGRPLGDLGIVAHLFGQYAAPGPLGPANAVASTLSRWGSMLDSSWLEGVLAGDTIATWAQAEPGTRFGHVATTAERTAVGVRVKGVKEPVESAAQADVLLVTARTDTGGLAQILIPADTPGVSVVPMGSLDLSRRFARIELDVELPHSAIVGEFGQARWDVADQEQIALALEVAQMVGAIDRVFSMTLQWSFDRYTFGRPLASYQELKHRFADMKAWLEASHAITDAAIRATDDRAGDAPELLSAAKAYVGHHGPEMVQDCIQMHGGIGVTFEHDLHIYLRRVVLGSRLYGSVTDHRERLTSMLASKGAAA